MELRQLQYVVAIAETGTFTRAAEQCHVVQSALSHQIARLERELGSPLFLRTSRRVRLSPAGEAFLPAARQTLAAAEHAREEVAAALGLVHGTLRVGMMPTLTAVDVIAALRRFRTRYPGVEVSVRVRPSEIMIEQVRDGGMDVAFIGGPEGQVIPHDVMRRHLAVDRLVLLARHEHVLATRRHLTLADLLDEDFVDYPAGSLARAETDEAFERAGLVRRVSYEVDHSALLARSVRAGLAVALVPPGSEDPRPDLVEVALGDPPTRAQHLIWHPVPGPAARAFLDGLDVHGADASGS